MGVIFLCGMTGAGKTTVGRRLAEKMRCAFLDTDEEIERRSRKSIADMFEQNGEAAFRQAETTLLEAIDPTENLIVALGAGALESPRNRFFVHERGTLVYLRIGVNTLLDRLGSVRAARPLLAECRSDDDLRRALNEMLARREADYLTADRIVDVNAQDNSDDVANRIDVELRFE
ncbi:MAG: shikimate kinase [bacterium]|nr:shikimate kinase [bacterium]